MHSADDMVIKRNEVKTEISNSIQNFIRETLESKEITQGLVISNLALTDFQFSEEFNLAIENKVKSEQEALKAVNEKVKTIVEAQAHAEEIMIRANAHTCPR